MDKEEYLELGLIYVQEGNLAAALKTLGTALIRYTGIEGSERRIDERTWESLPPELLSYYGLCVALVQNRLEDGLRFCKRALAKDSLRPEFYLNLGKIYLKANAKAKALKAFQRGLEISTRRNGDILYELKKMGMRKKQFFSFLPRGHFLNRYMGLLLHKLGKVGKIDEMPDPYTSRSKLR